MNEDDIVDLAAEFKIRTTIAPEDVYREPTERERIQGFFFAKFDSSRPPKVPGSWLDYVTGLGCVFLRFDEIIEDIYDGSIAGKVVVENPSSMGGVIVMTKEFAEKVLVLGGLP
jgi:hypothetical protein